MPKYGLEVSEGLVVEVDIGPGAPVPKSIDLDFEAGAEDELRRLVELLGFDAAEMDPTKTLFCRYGVPVTLDGDEVACCQVNLWIGKGLRETRPVEPPLPALERLRDEARAARTERERQEANAGAVAWAQSVGRPVELRDGEVVDAS